MKNIEKFIYSSPNGEIEGLKVLSDNKDARPILFCRGGNRNFGYLDDLAVNTLFIPFAKAGFSVYATQYSGAGESEGKDEYGGADVADVLALLDVMKADGVYRDGDFLGVLGFSRGAINACRAIQEGLPATRAAFVSGAYDLRNIGKERSDLVEMWERDGMFDVTEEELAKRSPVTFAADLPDIPFLLLHSKEDDRSESIHAEEMASALGDRADLKWFPGNDHGLMKVPEKRNQVLIDFFRH